MALKLAVSPADMVRQKVSAVCIKGSPSSFQRISGKSLRTALSRLRVGYAATYFVLYNRRFVGEGPYGR